MWRKPHTFKGEWVTIVDNPLLAKLHKWIEVCMRGWARSWLHMCMLQGDCGTGLGKSFDPILLPKVLLFLGQISWFYIYYAFSHMSIFITESWHCLHKTAFSSKKFSHHIFITKFWICIFFCFHQKMAKCWVTVTKKLQFCEEIVSSWTFNVFQDYWFNFVQYCLYFLMTKL